MSQADAFLRAIIEAPDDDAPRLVYADWLDDNGDPARAEFIRTQCRLAVLDADDPQRRQLQKREYELLADHWGEWAGPLVGRVLRWQFRRGFIEQVKAGVGQFLKEAKWLLDFAPIQGLEIQLPRPDEVRALLASRHLRRIAHLDLDHAKLGDEGVRRLAESPNLGRLKHLSLRFTEITTAGLCALAASPQLLSLRSLDVRANKLAEAAFQEFLSSCRLPHLERLEWDRKVGPGGIAALVSSPLAAGLTHLRFRECAIGSEGLQLLAEAPSLARLKELFIESDQAVGDAAAALAHAAWLPQLTSLALRCVALTDEGVRGLARSPRSETLRYLDLSFNRIGPAGARSLADAPLCENLTQLDLSGNPVGARGVKAVVTSPRLGNLRRLDLYQCEVTSAGVKSLLASPHLGRLTSVSLSENAIGRKAFDQLQAHFGDRVYHTQIEEDLSGDDIIRRVQAEPPRCLRGLGARPDTELIRRFPRDRLDPAEYAGVAFELTHPEAAQKAVLLGYEDTRGYDVFFSPYAIRWEPSGEQREFFDAEQHGRSAEFGRNGTIVGSGKRTPWRCGRRGCRDHAFIVTFFYRIEYPPGRFPDRYLPFADQFYHIDMDAYCGGQDRVIEIASFECK